jgi:putative spermidine/putrescine transport system permease protein
MSSPSDREGGLTGGGGLRTEEIEQAELILAEPRQETAALGERERGAARGRRGLITAAWTAPGALWLLFYLLAPVVMIVLVSFWTRTVSGFEAVWTLENYEFLFRSNVYWTQLWDSFWHSLVIVAAALLLGVPVAYFLAISVTSLRMQIALFIVALAPFWTSYLIRAVAWIPMTGREGALNTALQEVGLIDEPLDILLFSDFAVTVAMLQLYILFMIAPLFFMLAQIDRSSLEAARDLGANSFKTFREVILPQAMPGVVIGSIFVFILTMGEFATVRIIGGGQVASVGTIVQTQVASVQFPQAAASAVFLVVAMFLGVFVLLRFSNLREEL